MKLTRLRICPSVDAADNTISGQWHTGWRRSDNSDPVAFHAGGKWWRSTEEAPVVGPFASRARALAKGGA